MRFELKKNRLHKQFSKLKSYLVTIFKNNFEKQFLKIIFFK